MNQTDARILILRQLTGTLTTEEVQRLTTWRKQDPEHQAMFVRQVKLYRADWKKIPLSISSDFLAQQRSILLQRAMEHEKKTLLRDMRIRIAAVITLAVLASVFVYVTAGDVSENKLNFSRTELKHVTETLERTYNISFHVENPASGSLRFTGLFMNVELEVVLQSLQASLPITIEHRDHHYLLKEKH